MKVDLKRCALKALERAKEDLRRDKYLLPVAFIVTDEDAFDYNIEFENAEQKASVYAELVELAKKERARAIITINDANLKNPPMGQNDRPSVQECIFATVSGPGIQTWSISVPYFRTNDGILFRESQETLDDMLNLLPGWANQNTVEPV